MSKRVLHFGGSGGRGFKGGFGSVASVYLKKVEIPIVYGDFSIAALTKSNTLYALPAGGIVVFVRLKPSALFTGAGITEMYLSIGITGAIQDLMTEYDVLGTVVGDQEYAESFCAQSFDYNNTYNILISARSVGANLDQLSTGAAIVELYYISKVA